MPYIRVKFLDFYNVGLFYFIIFSGDVGQCETFDRAIKSRASDVTYSWGYVAESD